MIFLHILVPHVRVILYILGALCKDDSLEFVCATVTTFIHLHNLSSAGLMMPASDGCIKWRARGQTPEERSTKVSNTIVRPNYSMCPGRETQSVHLVS